MGVAVVIPAVVGRRRHMPVLETGHGMRAPGAGETPDAVLPFHRYLDRSRRWKTAGFCLGVAGAVIWRALTGSANAGVAAVIGVLAAAIVPELFSSNRNDDGIRVAPLRRRDLGTFVSPRGRAWLAGSAAMVVAAGTLRLGAGSGDIGTGMIAISIVGLAIIATLAARAVAHHPQPAAGHRDLEVDDAIRRAAIDDIVLAWGALNLVATCYIAPFDGAAQPWRTLGGLVIVVSILGVVFGSASSALHRHRALDGAGAP